MKISHIRITNVLGIDSLEFSPEGFTSIEGQNGQGKTSVLEAIKSATGVGHDATLLRKGAEKGEVVLVLDDGTEIQERITASRTTRDVIKDGKKLTKPSDTIKALTDALSVNPVEFLTARKQDRVQVLLESMPIDLDLAYLAEISGVELNLATKPTNPLQTIEFVRKQVFDERTSTNRAVKEKDATINQLNTALPDAPGGVEGDEDSLREQLEHLELAHQAEVTRIDTKLAGLKTEAENKRETVRAKARADIERVKDEADAEIEAIRARVALSVQTINTEGAAEVDKINAELDDFSGKANRVRTAHAEKTQQAVAPIKQAISMIAANRDLAAKRKATLDTIAKMEEELEDLRHDVDVQSTALVNINSYKEQLLASLPISGLEVKDGEIYRDSVPFDRLNTAQQVEIAVKIAELRAGDLKLVCLDGCELLDSAKLEALEAQTQAAGLQVFITKVNDGDFSVKTR